MLYFLKAEHTGLVRIDYSKDLRLVYKKYLDFRLLNSEPIVLIGLTRQIYDRNLWFGNSSRFRAPLCENSHGLWFFYSKNLENIILEFGVKLYFFAPDSENLMDTYQRFRKKVEGPFNKEKVFVSKLLPRIKLKISYYGTQSTE